MLDYNTLNNLVEVFKKNGIKNIELESGSTIEVKEGALLVNGEGVGVNYTAGDGISISEEGVISNTKKYYSYTFNIMSTARILFVTLISSKSLDEIYGESTNKTLLEIFNAIFPNNRTSFYYPCSGSIKDNNDVWQPLQGLNVRLESNSIRVEGIEGSVVNVQSVIVAKTNIIAEEL